ncbi:MAG: hypothetical protein RDV48_07695 [Candidatus Eremiobacteraeota bacterium]|nr:hypothetical protein [Candidatus Eremiobacteraeota bacterium]
MSISQVGGPSMPQIPERGPAAAAPQEEAHLEQADVVQLNVPVIIPKNMLVAGPDGKKPIDGYDVQFIPKGAVVTNQQEITDLVTQVKDQALPPGTKPEIADSSAGLKVAKGKDLISRLATVGGSFGLMNLMGSAPAAWAGPAAIAGGVAGTLAGADGVKKAFDMKGYYEGLKARGQEYIHVPVPTADGGQEMQNVKIDDLIKIAKDNIITGGMSTLGSALTAAAGMGGGPAVAIAAMVVQLGALLFASRHALASVAKKVGNFIKNKAVAVKNLFTGSHGDQKPGVAGPLGAPAAQNSTGPPAIPGVSPPLKTQPQSG